MNKNLITLIIASIVLALLSCSEIKNRELYSITDDYVDSLQTYYQRYGIFSNEDRFTSDGEYKVMPTGRLINVRIEHEATDEDYETLRDEIASHYQNDPRVKKVYICGFGTIMIDCRN